MNVSLFYEMHIIAFVFMADVHVFQVEANRQVFSTETQMINNLFVLTALTPTACIPLLAALKSCSLK